MSKNKNQIENLDSSHCYRADLGNPYRPSIDQSSSSHPRETSVLEWILTIVFCFFFVYGVLRALERFDLIQFDKSGDPVFPGERGWRSK